MSHGMGPIWTPSMDRKFRSLREVEHLAFTAIAERLALSKGAVMARAGELGMLKRGNRQRLATKAPARAANADKKHPLNIRPGFESPRLIGPSRGCLFPLWPTGKPTHLYCGAKRKAGKPYCAEHYEKTHTHRPELAPTVTP